MCFGLSSVTPHPLGSRAEDCPECDPVSIRPDAERDARVAARRAADARKAGRALDRLTRAAASELSEMYGAGWRDGYAASEDHYVGIPSGPGEVTLTSVTPPCPRPAAHMASEYADVRPRGFTGPMHDTCIETTGHGEVLAGTRSWVCGQDCPGTGPSYGAGRAR